MSEVVIVVTTSHWYDRLATDCRTFPSAIEAGKWISAEILKPETIECRCPSLGLSIFGPGAESE